MRKLLLVIFLLSFHILSFAPSTGKTAFIAEVKPINYYEVIQPIYEPLVRAIALVESNNNILAYNVVEDAVGAFQIRQCRIKHYNKLTGKDYTLKDMYDYNKAKEVFVYFIYHDNRGRIIHPKSYEQAAKNWNGSGPMTENYWKRVQKVLYHS